MPEDPGPADHRRVTAARRRAAMRDKLLEATMVVFTQEGRGRPVIEDVVRQAEVSRTTFYKHFDSLEEAFVLVGQQLSDQFTVDILRVYDVLGEPWQRFAVGFRVFLMRAMLDKRWAGFITRMDVWPHHSLVAHYMTQDIRRGIERQQFTVANAEAAADFLMGAAAGCINALRNGVADPQAQIDLSVQMGLASLGCTPPRCAEGMRFARRHLSEWGAEYGAPDTPRP
jgi:AcrR family transcriptional regulator